MHTDHTHPSGKRSGFTLIEMLVVLSIVLTLAVLTVLFMPRIAERQKVPRGADLLQGWLLMAKQRALRDRIATGVRLQPSAQNAIYVSDLQYIQKPDDYSPNGLLTNWIQATQTCTFGPGVNLYGSGDLTTGTSLVQIGDYLQLRSEGPVHRITGVPAYNSCTLASDLLPTNGVLPGNGASFRIIRQPRLLVGEQPLQMPQDVIIDLARSSNVLPLGPPSGPWEILFSPSGRVVGKGTGNTPIALRIRDVTQDTNSVDQTPMGDQTLIAIYPRTGLIASHPVAQGADPFLFIKDGRSSGF